jgi:hypothetical protein
MRFCRRTSVAAIAGMARKRGCTAPPPRIVFQIGLRTREKGLQSGSEPKMAEEGASRAPVRSDRPSAFCF